MVDPLTTLGIAANVIQLLTFAGNLLSKGREIRDAAYGAPVAKRELETVTESLRQLSANLILPETGNRASIRKKGCTNANRARTERAM